MNQFFEFFFFEIRFRNFLLYFFQRIITALIVFIHNDISTWISSVFSLNVLILILLLSWNWIKFFVQLIKIYYFSWQHKWLSRRNSILNFILTKIDSVISLNWFIIVLIILSSVLEIFLIYIRQLVKDFSLKTIFVIYKRIFLI